MARQELAGPLAYALAGPALDRVGTLPVLLVVAAGVSLAAITMLTLVRQRNQSAQPVPQS